MVADTVDVWPFVIFMADAGSIDESGIRIDTFLASSILRTFFAANHLAGNTPIFIFDESLNT